MLRIGFAKISIKTLLIVILLSFPSCKKEHRTISYPELVNRLTDLKALAKLPKHGEQSAMWSSYDRKSKVDSVTGKFIDWDANIDGLRPQYIRKEGENEVLAEMTGPGAIVRIWSASPMDGKVKIFIDGNEVPVVNESFIDYFKPSIPAFGFSELVYETNARGFNNYVPIPYQKSCRIVAEPGWGQYYQFNYITFPKGTQVEAFNPNLTVSGKMALDKVNAFFAQNMGDYPNEQKELKKKSVTTRLGGGDKKTPFDLKGTGAIASIKVKLEKVDSANIAEILRKVTLEIKWDGEKSPSVWTPLGDFFGTSPGWNDYKTLPMGMTSEWMYSYWYMPFKNGAKITLNNTSDIPAEITLEIGQDHPQGAISDYGRFHAKWHRDLAPLPKDRWPDWTLLETQGRGRFIGAHLLVWNPKGGSNSNAGPGYYWWGEGDEKFFVDGENFPSTFGTGTEDYFGYAWCIPKVFQQAFHSQTLDNDNMGYQPMNRWQIIDNVPFQKSFEGYLEKYFANDWPTQYSTVVYWYLDADGEDTLTAVSPTELYGYETPFKVFRAPNVLEAENMSITHNTGGWASTNVWANENLFESVSGHKIIQWFTAKDKENTLRTNFEWPQSGTYEVYANLVKQEDGGQFDLKINGKKLKRINFYASKENRATQKVKLGRVLLKPGQQQLEFDWSGEGKAPKALRIDYLEFKK